MGLMRPRLGAFLSLLFLASTFPAAGLEAATSRAGVQEEIDRLASQLGALDEDFNEARINLHNTERQIRELEVAKQEADQQLEKLRQAASARAAASYRMGVPTMILALFGSDSYDDFFRRMGVSSRVGDWESGLVTDLQIANNRARQTEEELRQELTRARQITEALEQKRTQLRAQESQQRALLERLASQERNAVVRQGPNLTIREPQLDAPPLPAAGNTRDVIAAAHSLIGTPYQWGGSGPNTFDCSGFTSYVWRRGGVSLPHSSRAQYAATKRVARGNLQPGDLVFFGSPIHHVGLYIGGGRMIDASTYGRPVAIRSIDRRGYAGAGRPGV